MIKNKIRLYTGRKEKEKMFYKKNLNLGHIKEAYNYLHDHYKYPLDTHGEILTIANNVKAYNLDLKNSVNDVLDTIFYDNSFAALVSSYINGFEDRHLGYSVDFMGRLNGYLVLTRLDEYSRRPKSCMPFYIIDWDYKYFKNHTKETKTNIYAYEEQICELAKVVRDFDKLCDKLAEILDEITSENLVAEKEASNKKYAIIHSTGIKDPSLSEVNVSFNPDLETALAAYDAEEPYGYDFDEVLLIEVVTEKENPVLIDSEYSVLKYKGGQPRELLLEKKYQTT